MSKQLKAVPKFANEAEESAFWEKHDSADYLDWTKAQWVVPPNLKPPAPQPDIKLSPDLQNLLRVEMREITTGVQGIAVSLATADWHSIQEISTKIRTSYIMEKKLTPAQAKELEQVLPEQFKQLDAEFHQRAEWLGVAAAAHDPELVAFHYSRWWKAVPFVMRHSPSRVSPDFRPLSSRAIITN